MELRYEYNDDGSLKRTSAVDQSGAEWSTYGPEKYVVEYEYDSVGRVARKVVRDTPSDDDSTRFDKPSPELRFVSGAATNSP
jgi:hypothetical protein